jgi:hypothetical protein
MRIGSVLLIVWLAIGALADSQGHYDNGSAESCVKVGTIALTVIAGPLNHFGVNPKISCKAPQPQQLTHPGLATLTGSLRPQNQAEFGVSRSTAGGQSCMSWYCSQHL